MDETKKLQNLVDILIHKMSKLCKKISFNSEKGRWNLIRRINKIEEELKLNKEEVEKYKKIKLRLSKAANFYRKMVIDEEKSWEENTRGPIEETENRSSIRTPDKIHGTPIIKPEFRRFKN